MTRAILLVLAVALSSARPAGRTAGGAELSAAAALAIGTWVDAVRTHAPGGRDNAARLVSTLTIEQRTYMNEGMPLFLGELQGHTVRSRNAADKHVIALAKALKATLGTDVFLKRAAVLHGDVAMQHQGDELAPADSGPAQPPGPRPPLLQAHRNFLDRDGEILGQTISDWNWPFARSLLDLLVPEPAADPFVSTWYHATTAFMLERRNYAELEGHLTRASEVLPEDPLALYDRASYAEIQGLPGTQVLLSDEEMLARRAGRGSSIRIPVQRSPGLSIPLFEVTNANAERLFREALRADPSLVEARVRLARLLQERKRHEDAAAELTIALAGKPEAEVAYYAHLFAGRSAQALGNIADASIHYRDAGALFPHAQSALLAQSQAALLGADVAGAVEAMERLERLAGTRKEADDPWWVYQLGAGRDASVLLRAMWEKAAAF